MTRAFAYAASVMALAAVIGGMYLAGSPAKERSRQLDQRRESDLQNIASAVDAFHMQRGSLPESLAALRGVDTTYLYGGTTDPATKAEYEYRTTGETTYELCAAFDAESTTIDAYGNPRPMVDPYSKPIGVRTWEHGAGRSCFTLDAEQRLDMVACSLTLPCAAGQSCVTLPERVGAVCVPQGKECAAAKCTGGCVIAESYPAQVRCDGSVVAPAPKKPAGSSTCDLMQEKKTGKVDCYGCAGSTCTQAPSGWVMYERDPDAMGISYACYESESGCQLAQ